MKSIKPKLQAMKRVMPKPSQQKGSPMKSAMDALAKRMNLSVGRKSQTPVPMRGPAQQVKSMFKQGPMQQATPKVTKK